MTELCDRTATELAAMLRAGRDVEREIAASCLARIDAVDDRVQAFLARTDDLAQRAGGRRRTRVCPAATRRPSPASRSR